MRVIMVKGNIRKSGEGESRVRLSFHMIILIPGMVTSWNPCRSRTIEKAKREAVKYYEGRLTPNQIVIGIYSINGEYLCVYKKNFDGEWIEHVKVNNYLSTKPKIGKTYSGKRSCDREVIEVAMSNLTIDRGEYYVTYKETVGGKKHTCNEKTWQRWVMFEY